MKRQPVVAGQFYAGNADRLRHDLEQLVPQRPAKPRTVTGIIAPHAGYVYSGAIAGSLYAEITIPDTALIIGPNHRGRGAGAALYPDGEWQTPLGTVPISSRLNSLMLEHVPFVRMDSEAHEQEHSLEVQVPFLQYLHPVISISALCLGHGDFEAISMIGAGVAEAIKAFNSPVLVVASSDMTHYETADSARRKDSLALERIKNFDPEGLLEVCQKERITMCGAVPAAVLLVAARELGCCHTDLVAYGTSGDVTGDNHQVVGYASVAIW